MKLVIDLGAEQISESAKLPNHIVRRAKGQPSRVCFRKSAKPELSAAFKAGKSAYGAAKKLHSANANLEKLTAAQKAKPSEARKTRITALRASVKTNRTAMKGFMSAARKSLRKFGTTVSLPFTLEQLSDAKKFAKVATPKAELNVTGIKGTVAPTLIADDKWAEAVNAKAGKAAAKAPAKAPAKPATRKKAQTLDEIEDEMTREAFLKAGKKVPRRLLPGAGGYSTKKAKEAREQDKKVFKPLPLKPGKSKEHAAFMRSLKKEEAKTAKSLKTAMGLDKLPKADLSKMSYSLGKNGSLQLLDKHGKEHNFTKAKLAASGLDIDDVSGLLESHAAHQYNITNPERNPEYGAAKKRKK